MIQLIYFDLAQLLIKHGEVQESSRALHVLAIFARVEKNSMVLFRPNIIKGGIKP